jgi:hypothetical protein
MFRTNQISMRALGAFALVAAAAAVAPAAALAATASDQTSFAVTAGSLSFSPPPKLPTLNPLLLNGQAQTTNTPMTNFTVQDATGSGSGWNVTVIGDPDKAGGKSDVFAEYCPNTTCGTHSGPGYVSGGETLRANSLTLTSTNASFSAQGGSTGTFPTLQCSSGCAVDSGSAVKVAQALANAGMGTWTTTGWDSTSLALATPTTLKTLSANEVYRVDLVWSLNSGPN